MSKKIGIIFDMDGVLVNNSQYHVQAWNLFLEMHGISFREDMKTKVFGTTNKEHLELFFNRKLTEMELNTFENEKEQLYRDLYAPKIKPVHGLIPFLKILKKNQIPISLATSAPKSNVDFTLDKLAVRDFFKVIIDSSSIIKGKPDPEIYLKAILSLGMQAKDCIVIEDSINGIFATKSAGAKVIGITTTHKTEELPLVDLIIDNFFQLSIHRLEELI
jgi:HAD superfamily hydrolase (TIGR01509 family)